MTKEDKVTSNLLSKLQKKFETTPDFPYSIYFHKNLKYYNYCNTEEFQPLVVNGNKDYYFQTDLIICDSLEKNKNLEDKDIVDFGTPRVVIEIKNENFNSHDVITYAEKAKRHKILCPHLQYGFLVINNGSEIPTRLINHGINYDFVYMLYEIESNIDNLFKNIIVPAIENSKNIEKLLSNIKENKCINKEQWFRREFKTSSCIKNGNYYETK